MDRNEFDTKFKNTFSNHKIIKYIKTEGSEDYFNCILDIAHFVECQQDAIEARHKKTYTPHNFSNHIINVIKNTNGIFTDETIKKFSVDELFCFILACIMHDIGMIYYADENRKIHSYIAADMICDIFLPDGGNEAYKDIINSINANRPKLEKPELLEKLKTSIETILSNYKILDTTLRRQIGVMIFGHSDLKIPINDKDRIDTLNRALYEDWGFESFSNVHILAAYLRWADELDLSEERSNGFRRNEIEEDAEPFWDNLSLVTKVKITPTSITLQINSKNYNTDKQYSYGLLKSIIAKLNKERKVINDVFKQNDKEALKISQINDENIEPKTVREHYSTFIPSSYTVPNDNGNNNNASSDNSALLDQEELRAAIEECINERHLCKEGHYCLHNVKENGIDNPYCIRNPIDCNGLLSRHDLLDDIALLLLAKIIPESDKDSNIYDYLLIGIANSGALIGAHMSGFSGIPFAPWVPDNKCVQYTPQEKDLEYIIKKHPDKKIALVIGVNYTGKAISDACSKFDNVKCVVGLINRDIQEGNKTSQIIQTKELNKFFIIEGYEIEECQFSKSDDCPYHKICTQHTFDQE